MFCWPLHFLAYFLPTAALAMLPLPSPAPLLEASPAGPCSGGRLRRAAPLSATRASPAMLAWMTSASAACRRRDRGGVNGGAPAPFSAIRTDAGGLSHGLACLWRQCPGGHTCSGASSIRSAPLSVVYSPWPCFHILACRAVRGSPPLCRCRGLSRPRHMTCLLTTAVSPPPPCPQQEGALPDFLAWIAGRPGPHTRHPSREQARRPSCPLRDLRQGSR